MPEVTMYTGCVSAVQISGFADLFPNCAALEDVFIPTALPLFFYLRLLLLIL